MLDPPRDDALVAGAAAEVTDEETECEPPEPRDLDPPPPDVVGLDGVGSFGTDGVGSDGVRTVGVGSDGVETVGVGSDGVLTVGTGTGNRTVGVVTGGVTGVDGTVSDGAVRATLAWLTVGELASSARTSASKLIPSPQNAPRRSQPPDSWPRRVASCRPLIAPDIYPTLRNSNRRSVRLFERSPRPG